MGIIAKKKYKVGMYGGKFLPMHKGHRHCLDVAAGMWEKVYLIMFHGGAMERLVSSEDRRDMLSVPSRWEQVRRVASGYDNVAPICLDISSCVDESGGEDWDAETPLVVDACGHIDAVFGSEESYAEYFSRAYPNVDYVLVDVKRKAVPISATMVRAMGEKEAKEWMV